MHACAFRGGRHDRPQPTQPMRDGRWEGRRRVARGARGAAVGRVCGGGARVRAAAVRGGVRPRRRRCGRRRAPVLLACCLRWGRARLWRSQHEGSGSGSPTRTRGRMGVDEEAGSVRPSRQCGCGRGRSFGGAPTALVCEPERRGVGYSRREAHGRARCPRTKVAGGGGGRWPAIARFTSASLAHRVALDLQGQGGGVEWEHRSVVSGEVRCMCALI